MLDAIFDPIARFAVRYEKPLTYIGIAWFALSCAAMARFIPLPDIPYITDRNAWMFSGPWNALWWGFLRPQTLKRKEALQSAEAPARVQQDDA